MRAKCGRRTETASRGSNTGNDGGERRKDISVKSWQFGVKKGTYQETGEHERKN